MQRRPNAAGVSAGLLTSRPAEVAAARLDNGGLWAHAHDHAASPSPLPLDPMYCCRSSVTITPLTRGSSGELATQGPARPVRQVAIRGRSLPPAPYVRPSLRPIGRCDRAITYTAYDRVARPTPRGCQLAVGSIICDHYVARRPSGSRPHGGSPRWHRKRVLPNGAIP